MAIDPIKQPGGLPTTSFAPINPAGLSVERIETERTALDEAIKSLESRYENPNWFNVAAGFFKPQLGGFTASLGSASQALGQNVELQRANIAPVAAMRIDKARLDSLQQQKINADKLAEDYRRMNPGKPFSADVIGQAQKLDPDGPAVTGMKEANAEFTRLGEQNSTQASTTGTVLTNQQFINSHPWLMGIDDDISSIGKKTPQQAATVVARLDRSRPTSIDPVTWASMDPVLKRDAIATYAGAQAELGMKEEDKARDLAAGASTILPHLLASRQLIVGSKPDGSDSLFEVLGKLQGSDLFSAIAREVKERGLTNGGMSASIASIISDPKLGATPDQINRIQLLIKDLAAMQADQRDSSNNPTNMYQSLRSEGSPTIANTGNAILRMFDMAAIKARKDLDSYSARIDAGVDARHTNYSTGVLGDISKAHADSRKQLATLNPTIETPSFYTKPTFWDGKAVPNTGKAPAGGSSAAKPTPTAQDIAYAKAHPEQRASFIRHFGVEP